MAEPDDPLPPIEGGEQDIDSAGESSAAEAPSGPEETAAGEHAAPPPAHEESDFEVVAEAETPADSPRAQDREVPEEAIVDAAEPPAPLPESVMTDEVATHAPPESLALSEPPPEAHAETDVEAIEPEPAAPAEDAPALAAFEAPADLVESALVEPEPEPAPRIEPEEPAPRELASTDEALATEEDAAPEAEGEAEPKIPALAAFEALSKLADSAPAAAAPEPVLPAEEPAELELASVEEASAETVEDVPAPPELAEPEAPPLAAFEPAPAETEIAPPIAASEAAPADIYVAPPETVAAAPIVFDDAPSAVEALAEDPVLFTETAAEEPIDDGALFPATPAQDEAALFTPGIERPAPTPAAPDIAAEIIPYTAPVDDVVPPPVIEEPPANEPKAPPLAARVNPEDLAAPSASAPPPVAIAALAAAFAWLRQKTDAPLSWLRARFPRAPETPDAAPAPARRRKFWTAPRDRRPGFSPSLRKIAIMSGWATVLIAASVCGFFIYLTRDMPSTRSLWTADNSPSLTFMDRRGRVIIREGAESAPPVDISRLPAYVPQAMLAIEDRRFYEHFGIDFNGLMRAAASNMKAGHVVQGGSTITQQLAKNLFLSNSRTFQRKVQEFALALWLESQFSKRDILALYISRVYFGAGAYGIEAAAERYFDKPAKDLSLPEAALLAGLVKAPSKLNPAAQDAAAKARAKIVLDEMLSAGFITAAQRDTALKAPLAISRNNPNGNLGYFRDWIDPQLTRVLGDQRDDFIIETTLDLDAQRAAESTLDRVIERERKLRNVSQGAVLAMDSTGGVTTMVGGLNYGKGQGQSEFNRTTQSLRAPGSSFKYFIYMAAMAKGLTPWNIYVDKPVVIGDWAPGNYEDKYYGPVTLASAYAKSLNMVAIQLANDVGGRAVIDTAQSLGVGKRLQDYRSLGLGAQGMTVMEMVTGYGAMASGGYPIEPHGIERVRRANGQVLWARRPATPPRQVIEDRTMRMMNYLGASVVRAGTGTRAQIPGREIAGKTGTSNDYRDAWFIGYVPGMVAGVWVGNDNNTSMTKVTGGLLGAEIWHDVMVVALRDTPIQQLAMPEAQDMPIPEEVGVVTETPPGTVEVAQPAGPPEPPRAPLAVTPVGGDG